MDARRFVGAVLGPHHAENAELREVWLAAENFFYFREFDSCEIMLRDRFGGDPCFGLHQLNFPMENKTEILTCLPRDVDLEKEADTSKQFERTQNFINRAFE
jgi:hypothetical protein